MIHTHYIVNEYDCIIPSSHNLNRLTLRAIENAGVNPEHGYYFSYKITPQEDGTILASLAVGQHSLLNDHLTTLQDLALTLTEETRISDTYTALHLLNTNNHAYVVVLP